MGQVQEVTCNRKWQYQTFPNHYSTDAKLRSMPSLRKLTLVHPCFGYLFPVYIYSHSLPVVPTPAPRGSSVELLSPFSDLQRIQRRSFSLLCQFPCNTKDSCEHWAQRLNQTSTWLAPLLIHVSRLSPGPSLWHENVKTKCALVPPILPKLLSQFCHFPLVHYIPMGLFS